MRRRICFLIAVKLISERSTRLPAEFAPDSAYASNTRLAWHRALPPANLLAGPSSRLLLL